MSKYSKHFDKMSAQWKKTVDPKENLTPSEDLKKYWSYE